MSNSTTLLDTITSNQAAKEVTANALFDAASPAMIWGRHASASSGLTWAFYGGQYGTNAIANGTVTLTASTTNYVYADNSTGAVSVNTTGVPSGKIPLYTIVTGATTVTSYTDTRSYAPTSQLGGGGGSGTVTSVSLTLPGFLSVAGSPVTTSGTFAVTLATQAANAVFAGPTSGSAAAPTFRALVGADVPVMVASGGSHAPGGVPDPGATSGATRFLREDATWQVPAGGGGSSTLASLTDVNVTEGPGIDGYSLVWNNSTSKWIASNISGGGSGSSITGTAGSGSGAGGVASATGGVGGATGNGGALTLAGGAGGSTSGTGGATSLVGGDGLGSTSGSGGNVTISGGAAKAGSTSGNVSITGGSVSGSSFTGGGTVNITGGGSVGAVNITTAGSSSGGGPVNINTGGAQSAFLAGGAIAIKPGSSWATTGPAVAISGGDVSIGPAGGGAVTLTGGTATGTSTNGGAVVLTGGTPGSGGAAGNIVLNGSGAALATTATGGFVNVPTCAGAPTGTPAVIPTGTVPIVFDTTNIKLMAYTGGAWNPVVPSGGGSSGPNMLSKTANYTASANDWVACNTTGGSFTVTLPASPTAGQQVFVSDEQGYFGYNPISVDPNGGKIHGLTSVQQFYKSTLITFTYQGSTNGWLVSGAPVCPPIDMDAFNSRVYPIFAISAEGRHVAGMTLQSGGAWGTAAGSRDKTTGKLYFEFLHEFVNSANSMVIGVMPIGSQAVVPNNYPGSSFFSYGVLPQVTGGGTFAQLWNSGASIASEASSHGFLNGDLLGFAIDIGGGSINIYRNNTLIITKTGLSFTTPLCLAAGNNVQSYNAQGVFATRVGQLKYAPPSGYSAWDN